MHSFPFLKIFSDDLMSTCELKSWSSFTKKARANECGSLSMYLSLSLSLVDNVLLQFLFLRYKYA